MKREKISREKRVEINFERLLKEIDELYYNTKDKEEKKKIKEIYDRALKNLETIVKKEIEMNSKELITLNKMIKRNIKDLKKFKNKKIDFSSLILKLSEISIAFNTIFK